MEEKEKICELEKNEFKKFSPYKPHILISSIEASLEILESNPKNEKIYLDLKNYLQNAEKLKLNVDNYCLRLKEIEKKID